MDLKGPIPPKDLCSVPENGAQMRVLSTLSITLSNYDISKPMNRLKTVAENTPIDAHCDASQQPVNVSSADELGS
jgi:hypothetical protein